MFQALIGVSNVGPKAALSLLSVMNAEELVTAIVDGDLERLSSAPGVSRKGAERLSLELKDKLKGEAELVIKPKRGKAYDDALSALVVLGYPAPKARRALAESSLKKDLPAEEMIRLALRRLSE